MGRGLALRGRSSRLALLLLLLALLISSTSAFAGHFVDVGTTLNVPTANAAAWGDYDDDGYPDLYMGGYWGVHRAYLLHNNGNGTFTDVTVAMGLHIDAGSWEDNGAAWGDFNNDGAVDLLVVGGGTHLPFLYRNDGDHFTDIGGAGAGFSSKWYAGTGGAWGDYDGDNWLDIFISSDYWTAPSFLYHNNRDGTFTEVTSAAGMDLAPATYATGCTWVDYNNDGLLDLVVSRTQEASGNQQTPLLYHNDGDDTFTDMGVAADMGVSSLQSVAAGDYDNDGFFDLYFGGNQNRATLFEHNNEDGSFTNIYDTAMSVGAQALGVAWGDYDNDGLLDLAQGNGELPTYNEPYPSDPFLFHNDGSGTFNQVAADEGITAVRKFRATAWSDFNRDGHLDLLMAAADSYSCLYQNTGAAGDGNWIRVRALTSASGDATDGSPVRDALGARVDVNLDNDLSFPPGRTVARVIDGGSGFMSQNEPIGQFGLGTATTVAVRVAFPNHHIVTQSGIAANQQIEIRDVQQGIGAIQGTVTDARNSNPVIGGSVTCTYLTAITDVSGNYRIPVVPAGSYSVTASGVGFASLTMDNVVVPSGSAVTVNFALSLPPGTIEGAVNDARTGFPIAGATVTCSGHTVTTGADGAYSFTLVAGSYTVVASAPGYQTGTVQNVTVTPAQVTTLNVSLTQIPGSISGQVTDALSQAAVAGAVVSCEGVSATSDASGQYLLSVPPAAGLLVTATAAGFHAASITGVNVTSGQTTALNIALDPLLGAISGTVVDDATRLPLLGVTVTGGGVSATTDFRGAYGLADVRIGTYTVHAALSGYSEGTVNGVVVADGATATADLALTATVFGSIGGKVTDAANGAGIQHATVSCGALSATTAADGSYAITGVPAGEGYRVGASAGGYEWGTAAGVSVVTGLTSTQNFALTQLPFTPGAEFQEITGLNLPISVGLGWGDYDGDGYPDLFVGGYNQGTEFPQHGPVLYHNNQDLTFTDVGQSLGLPSDPVEQDGIAWGDYDNDGDLDVLVGSGGGYPMLYRRDPTQFIELGQSAGFHVSFSAGRGTNWCDYNGDNLLEAFCSNIFGPGYLMRNNGDGTFAEVSVASGLTPCDSAQSASWGDYNNDGWPDLVLARLAKPTLLFCNNGDGTFTDVSDASGMSAYVDAYSAVWGDYDNDGWLDCYVTSGNYTEPQLRRDALFHNNRDGTFTDVSNSAGLAGDAANGTGAAWADYDNDGYLDVSVGNLGQPSFLYRNNGDGVFTDVAGSAGVAGPYYTGGAVAWADIDLDGRLDLVASVGDADSHLFHNITAPANWLRVRAVTNAVGDATDTSKPIRDAIGARVEVNVDNDPNFPPGHTLTRMIDGGSGFCGQNEQIAQFGIPAAGPMAVRVRFPDGTVVIHYGIEVNQTLLVEDVAAALAEDKFTDAGYDNWAYAEIEACVAAGIVKGSGGSYFPTNPVTRDQLAVYIARAMNGGDPTGSDTLPFVDITNPWANVYIAYCIDHGVVKGFDATHYGPTLQVDRGSMAVFVARAEGWVSINDPMDTAPELFADVPAGYWSGTAVKACVDHGVVNGYDATHYQPTWIVSRDQMAVFVTRAFQLPT